MKNIQKTKKAKADLRKNRTRRKIIGKSTLLRLTIFRSAKHLYMQIIDDKKGKTICAANDLQIKGKKDIKPMDIATEIGKTIAKKAVENKIEKVVFDRGPYKYHGRVKAAADGARDAGLKF
ncbi:50S ribosomal protein L18 [Candidatus Kuenenbacteria bacterium]|nr:50S ribosomal protein L18 [Candidatus Kuenenbacteria bacterium]